MQEAIEHLRKALVHLNKGGKPIYALPHSEKRALLYAILTNAYRLIDSACCVLEREKEE